MTHRKAPVPTIPLLTNPPAQADPPAPQAIPWYKSQRFIALCQTTALTALGWLLAALTSNDWQWRGVAIAIGSNILLVLKDWWSPNVVAPIAALNRNNVGAA